MPTPDFLAVVLKQFQQYKKLADEAINRVSDEQLLHSPGEEANSMAVLIRHLSGNIMSRWTDFLNSDGEKPWRRRDEEFENLPMSRQALLHIWEQAWTLLQDTLSTLGPDDLQKTVLIRNEPHTVMAAINRQVAHCAYHIGQMVYLSKWYAGPAWVSLSIPRGESEAYNALKAGA